MAGEYGLCGDPLEETLGAYVFFGCFIFCSPAVVILLCENAYGQIVSYYFLSVK